MAAGYIASRKVDDEGREHAARLRAAVTERAKGKNISLVQALREISEEGRFSAANTARDTLIRERRREADGCKGWGRGVFARAVGAKIVELRDRNRHLSERQLFSLASDTVAKQDPQALRDYRRDVETI